MVTDNFSAWFKANSCWFDCLATKKWRMTLKMDNSHKSPHSNAPRKKIKKQWFSWHLLHSVMCRDKFGLLLDAQSCLLKFGHFCSRFLSSWELQSTSVRCVCVNKLPGQKLEFLSAHPSLQDGGGLCWTHPHPQLFIRKRWSYITKMAEDPMH